MCRVGDRPISPERPLQDRAQQPLANDAASSNRPSQALNPYNNFNDSLVAGAEEPGGLGVAGARCQNNMAKQQKSGGGGIGGMFKKLLGGLMQGIMGGGGIGSMLSGLFGGGGGIGGMFQKLLGGITGGGGIGSMIGNLFGGGKQ